MTQEDYKLLELFKPLRVADVRDGMDWMGYHFYGTVDKNIRPLYRTKAVGIAHTARYIPYEGPHPIVTSEQYKEWSDRFYNEVCTYPWVQDIEEGTFMCIDVAGVDVGLIGSENSLSCKISGCVGFLLNGGGIRDTDECIAQQIPVWSYFVSQKMDQARLRFVEKNVPIAIGGVAVYPGDIVVADGDGVIVVPRKVAYDVAKYASRELFNDKNSRREKYEALGWKLDDSVINS